MSVAVSFWVDQPLIVSPGTNLIPSQPPRTTSEAPIIATYTPTQVESGPHEPGPIDSFSAPIVTVIITLPSNNEPPELSTSVTLDPPALTPTNVTPTSIMPGSATGTSLIQSTDQALKPIPPAETQVGDPNGHHEITEPNFTATKPCRGCSPVIEITATGWLENPAGEQHATVTIAPPKITLGAGPSNVVISQDSTDGNFVIGGSTTLIPGQTVTIDDTPIAIQTLGGKTQVVVGTTAVPLEPETILITEKPKITVAPILLPPIITLGTTTITANAQTEYAIADQTLKPGGDAITVSGTVFSLAPSATAVVVNGRTSSLAPVAGGVYTTVAPAALTFKDHIYTTNRAGWIVMGPSTTLIPGGPPVTIDGTTLSLEHSGTAVIVQGTTSMLQPVTTVVTLTRSLGDQTSTGDGGSYPTAGTPVSANATFTATDGWLGGLAILIWWTSSYFAIRL